MSASISKAVGGLSLKQYQRLMSPSENTPANPLKGRKVRWIRNQLAHITLFFRRLMHSIFHGFTWENDRTLFNRFTAGISKVWPINEAINKLAQDLILRNPNGDKKPIDKALDWDPTSLDTSTQTEILKEAEETKEEMPGKRVGRYPTLDPKTAMCVLNPNLDQKVIAKNKANEALPEVIQRRKEIAAAKALYASSLDAEKQKRIEDILSHGGEVAVTSQGQGCAYFLKSPEKTEYVLKPHGEGTNCIDNRKRTILPDDTVANLSSYHTDISTRVRKSIPLYFEVLSEVLFYKVAQLFKLEHAVPETFAAIVNSNVFYHPAEDPLNRPIQEKLCSAQKFEKSYGQLPDCSDARVKRTKTDSVADSILLDIIGGNTDRYTRNLLRGKQRNLINIDNGLCFPESNIEIRICTVLFPQAERVFSEHHRNLINLLSDENDPMTQKLFAMVEKDHLAHAKACELYGNNVRSQQLYVKRVLTAMKARIAMAKWGLDKGMSMREIGLRVISLGYPDHAYREAPITPNDVDSFQLGTDGNNTWNDIIGRNLTNTQSDSLKPADDSGTFVYKPGNQDDDLTPSEDTGTFVYKPPVPQPSAGSPLDRK